MNARLNNNSRSPAKAVLAKTSTARPSAAKDIPHAADVSEDSLHSKWTRFMNAQDALLAELGAPSWKRKLFAFVAMAVVCAGIGWMLGNILAAMFIGMVLLTGSTFLAWTLYALGLVLGAFYGGKLAGRLGASILTGEADERCAEAWEATKSLVAPLNPMRWFGKSKTAAA